MPLVAITPETAAVAPRILALHLPWLATEVLVAGDPATAVPHLAGPALTWHTVGNRRLVAATDPQAAALGLRPGQALGDAQAIAPAAAALPHRPEAMAARLAELSLWALRVAPLVALSPPDGLLVNIAGTEGVLGREEAVLRRTVAGLARLGHLASGAVAGSAGAAMALARCGIPAVVPVGEEAAALTPLPVAALRPEGGELPHLARLGLHRIGDLMAQPRGPLVRRFGTGLALALDRATGAAAEPFRSIRPAPDRHVAFDFEEPLITRAAIDIAAERLLALLCARLAEEGRGLRRLLLRAHRADGGVQEVSAGLGQASRDPRHLGRLLSPKLESLSPGFGFDRIALMAGETEPLAAAQSGLQGGGLGGEEGHDALAALLDRVEQRLPAWRLRPRASHWPERAVERADPFSPMPAPETCGPEGWAARLRPLRLLRRPERLEAMAVLPDDPPFRIRWRGAWFSVRAAEGPERLAPEWWRDRPGRLMRDYYRLEMADGRRFWICRAGEPSEGGWFLHGLMP